jgi:hypothetical protein
MIDLSRRSALEAALAAPATLAAQSPNETVRVAVIGVGNRGSYLSLAAFIDNARGHKTPLNNAESAARFTLAAMMGRRAIYEKRIVNWEEMQA